MNKNILISGSNSAIGSELAKKFRSTGFTVWTLSRHASSDPHHLQYDILDDMQSEQFKNELENMNISLFGVVNCTGILHDAKNMPEKQISEIDFSWLDKSFEVNLKHNIKLVQLTQNHMLGKSVFWVSLSAMVGSIKDNHLGGWHSYRMSKAALNMFIRGLAIEWKRTKPESCVIAIHPGTTDSPMSKPFKVRKDKLYSPELSAERLHKIIDSLSPEQTGSFLNWDNKPISW